MTIYIINNKVLLYSTGNYIQYPVINHNGKEYEKEYVGNSLVAQWLGLSTLTAVGLGSITGRGTKSPQAVWCGKKKKNKDYVYICITESLCCKPETNTTLYINLKKKKSYFPLRIKKQICSSINLQLTLNTLSYM